MVSNASEDFPEPLTPVTTVMALCGISTLIFFRLWTRAPRTRMDSCSVRTSVVAWVISLVAKGKPRQHVSRALPKLQIIRPMSKRGKRRVCRTGLQISPKNLRLQVQGNLADAAVSLQVNGRSRFPISIVGVGITIVFQSMHINGTDAAGRMSDDADVFRKADVGLAHPAFNVGGQIGLAVAREVNIHLARPDMEIQPGEWNVAKMQIPLPGSHIHLQLHRNVFAEMQIPIIF